MCFCAASWWRDRRFEATQCLSSSPLVLCASVANVQSPPLATKIRKQCSSLVDDLIDSAKVVNKLLSLSDEMEWNGILITPPDCCCSSSAVEITAAGGGILEMSSRVCVHKWQLKTREALEGISNTTTSNSVLSRGALGVKVGTCIEPYTQR